MNALDRPGIFKAVPVSWSLKKSQSSQSVAINIQFRILAQLDNGVWTDWSSYDEIGVYGDFWIIKKDGAVNSDTVDRLVEALGWDGNIGAVERGQPPYVLVQVTVNAEEYKGKTYFKAAWINHGNFSLGPDLLPPEEVSAIQTRFGSLLRAAAGAAKAKAKAKPVPGPQHAAPTSGFGTPSDAGAPLTVDETPF